MILRALPLPVLVLVLVLSHTVTVTARLLHSLPEDTYAFPKFRVAFLNGLPVLNVTAEKWLKEGLRGGQLEFLDQPWKDDTSHSPSYPKEIGSGHGSDEVYVPEVGLLCTPTENITQKSIFSQFRQLITRWNIWKWAQKIHIFVLYQNHWKSFRRRQMRMPTPMWHPYGAGLYFSHYPGLVFTYVAISLEHSHHFKSYQSAKHRQGWFTYSYCHNEEIRQFKELIPPQSRTAGNTISLFLSKNYAGGGIFRNPSFYHSHPLFDITLLWISFLITDPLFFSPSYFNRFVSCPHSFTFEWPLNLSHSYSFPYER